MQLPEVERQIITFVVRYFAESNRPTDQRDIFIKFKPHGLEAVHRLITSNVLRDLNSEKVIPNVVAFSLCGRPESELQAKSSFEMVLAVLQRLYDTIPKNIIPTTEILETDLKTIWPNINPMVMRLGLYQCYEMGFVGGWSWDNEAGVQSLIINPKVTSTDTAKYWHKYIEKQTKAVELSLRSHLSQRFLQGIADLAQGQEGIGIAPIQWVDLANNLGLDEDDRNRVVRNLMAENLLGRKPASDVLILTQKGIAELERLRQPFGTEGPIVLATSEPADREYQLLVFISHSSKDADLALALIELLKDGLGIRSNQIRCSSVDGYRLPVGVNTEAQLREEVNAAKVVVGLITPSSLASAFVMFELGARWGANQFLAPLLAGVRPSELSGPLVLLNCLSANNEAQLHQLLKDVAKRLGLGLQDAPSYVRYISEVKRLADAVHASGISNSEIIGAKPESENTKALRLSLTVVGTPPSPQMLRVQSNQVVKATRLDYLLSSGACVASDNLNLEGESLDVPIEDHQVLKLWNTPRGDRNTYDNSGPAKLRITLLVVGMTSPYIVPIQMDSYLYGSTVYRKLAGAEVF